MVRTTTKPERGPGPERGHEPKSDPGLELGRGTERERALHESHENVTTPRVTWDDAATGLIDAIVGLRAAPVTLPR
ncbi:hypothetical protein FHS43_002555 [Streptosporangium becharense]|uniref:Uncharacterized protein n=1 Tax=Streptosporangium becharense TaxID=1816182 RepID=A0A7W9MHZ8_9ACTN|nr:hypothetical protein [Streptosporangium becharense]MBB2911290.1 hypothetical protein [Streptosporangium becharense]MBB5821652.1 hypothetical protein [Streptosporangium becharense]